MKKSLRKTTAVALAVVSTAGIAGATTVATTNHMLNTNGTEIVVKADSTISNYLTKDVFNPIGGLNELKELIDVIHFLNFGVTLDLSSQAFLQAF